jgi:beta-lactamase regulating signal transducer with metallopeptidase domain
MSAAASAPGVSALLNGAILSAPLAAAVWLALRLIPRRVLNASTRYVIWWVTLAFSLALPVFLAQTRPAPASHPTGRGNLHIAVVNLEQQPAAHAGSLHLPVAVPVRPWLRLLPIAWIVASTGLLLRLLLSHFAVLRACARAADPPPEWRARIEPWRAAAGWRRNSVRIANSDEIPVPFAAGPFRPAIVIPRRLLDQLPGHDLHRIGLHEAAHLARLDDCAILAERLLVAIFPWHLAARWIARRIDAEREIACDDRVVEATGCARSYAECLTRVVELCGGVRGSLATASMAGRGVHLSQRVELLVNTPRHPSPRLLPVCVLPFAAGLLALVLAGARAPQLVALTAPVTPAPAPAAIPIPQQEIAMTSPTAKRLGRKLVVAAAATAALAAPARSTQTADPPAQAQAQPASSGRFLVFIVDTAGLSPADLQRASDTATKFVQGQMRPDDHVALLVSTDRGVNVRQDFTSDRDLLTKAAQLIVSPPDSSVTGVPRAPDRWVESLGKSVEMLGPIPGKKMVVYIAGEYTTSPSPDQVKGLINDAVRANVAFYLINVRGPGPMY